MAYEKKMKELAQSAKDLGDSFKLVVLKKDDELLAVIGGEDVWGKAQLSVSWAKAAVALVTAGAALIEANNFDAGVAAFEDAAVALETFRNVSDTDDTTVSSEFANLRLMAEDLEWSVGTLLSRHALRQRVRREAPTL